MSWSAPVVTVPPASEPVTLAQAKAQCRVTGTDEDTLLTRLITAARSLVESWCGIALESRTVTMACTSFCDFAMLPTGPVSAVSGIAYVDTAGVSQTLSTDVYELRKDGLNASIVLKINQSWPSIQTGSQIVVTAVIGGSPPEAAVHATLLLVGHWFETREAVNVGNIVTEMPLAVEALLCNHRRFA